MPQVTSRRPGQSHNNRRAKLCSAYITPGSPPRRAVEVPAVTVAVMGARRTVEGAGLPARAAVLARDLLLETDRLTDQLVGAIWQTDETYVGGSVSRTEVWESCRTNITRVIETLAGEVGPNDPYDAPRETGRRRAEQGVPLESVLHSYRVGGRLIWEALVAKVRAGAGDPDALLDAATSVWEVVDSFSTEVALAYREAEAERVNQDVRETQALVARLLLGGAADPDVADQARIRLGLPPDGGYVVVATGPDGEHWARSALSSHRLDSVWSGHEGHSVGLVPLRGRRADAVTRALSTTPAGSAGLGACAAMPGIDRAWSEARLALSTLGRGHLGPVTLDDRMPEALLNRSPDLADRLVDAVLGPVLELPDADVLIATLRTWLAEDRSPSRTAKTLYCHRNTVLNRLHRVSTVTGVVVDDAAHHLRLALALRALALRR